MKERTSNGSKLELLTIVCCLQTKKKKLILILSSTLLFFGLNQQSVRLFKMCKRSQVRCQIELFLKKTNIIIFQLFNFVLEKKLYEEYILVYIGHGL